MSEECSFGTATEEEVCILVIFLAPNHPPPRKPPALSITAPPLPLRSPRIIFPGLYAHFRSFDRHFDRINNTHYWILVFGLINLSNRKFTCDLVLRRGPRA